MISSWIFVVFVVWIVSFCVEFEAIVRVILFFKLTLLVFDSKQIFVIYIEVQSIFAGSLINIIA